VSSSTFNATDSLDNRWMVSLLGCGGVRVDPVDYVYLLGGYTYARLETLNSPIGIAGQAPLFAPVTGFTQFPNAVLRRSGGDSFGLNGATVGGGWERQIAPRWSLRGEYRYTKFQGKDVSENFVTNSSFVQVQQATGSVTRVPSVDRARSLRSERSSDGGCWNRRSRERTANRGHHRRRRGPDQRCGKSIARTSHFRVLSFHEMIYRLQPTFAPT